MDITKELAPVCFKKLLEELKSQFPEVDFSGLNPKPLIEIIQEGMYHDPVHLEETLCFTTSEGKPFEVTIRGVWFVDCHHPKTILNFIAKYPHLAKGLKDALKLYKSQGWSANLSVFTDPEVGNIGYDNQHLSVDVRENSDCALDIFDTFFDVTNGFNVPLMRLSFYDSSPLPNNKIDLCCGWWHLTPKKVEVWKALFGSEERAKKVLIDKEEPTKMEYTQLAQLFQVPLEWLMDKEIPVPTPMESLLLWEKWRGSEKSIFDEECNEES